jgi:hypothetical protein
MSIVTQNSENTIEKYIEHSIYNRFNIEEFRHEIEYDFDFNIDSALHFCHDYTLYKKELRSKDLYLKLFDYFDSLNLIQVDKNDKGCENS